MSRRPRGKRPATSILSAGRRDAKTRRSSSRWIAPDWRTSCAVSRQALDEEDAALVRAVFESYAYVSDLVDDKDTSIRRLRQLFSGARTEKTGAVVGPEDQEARCRSAA